MGTTDRAIIEEIRGGNIDRFELLVDKYSARIQSFVRSRLFKKEEADDIVQNSFIHFYKALRSFNITKPVYPYLLQIARNELNMYFRKNHPTLPLNEDVLQIMDTHENKDEINLITDGLKPDNKKALLWFAEGYSYQEIAKRLDKPLNTVRTLIHRARLFIQKNYNYER